MLIYFIFGVIGINSYKGQYWSCHEENIGKPDGALWDTPDGKVKPIDTMQDCMDFGGDWIRMDSNFDNI